MATSNNRSARLDIEVQATGGESVQKLSKDVHSLADAGGAASSQFVELASAFDRAIAEARASEGYAQAAKSLGQVSVAAKAAAEAASRLRIEFDLQDKATQAARASQGEIQTALGQTQKALSNQVLQLGLLKTAYKAGEVGLEEYKTSARGMTDNVAKLRDGQTGLQVALRAASTEAAAAARALESLRAASLAASQNSSALQGGLRDQGVALEAARSAAQKLGFDYEDLAGSQTRLNTALRDTSAALDAAAATNRLETEQKATAAAVQALTDDLDRQASLVRGALVSSIAAATAAYEKEQAALAASVAMAEKRVAIQREQSESDRLAALQVVGVAAARERAELAVRAELAALKDAEQFMQRYAASQAEMTAEAQRFVAAEEAVAAAADKASRAVAEEFAEIERLRQAEQYVRDLENAFKEVDKATAQAAAEVKRLQGYFDKLSQQRDVLSNAFGATGVRSIQAIEREMFQLQRSVVTLGTELRTGGISMQDFDRATAGAAVRLRALKTEIATIPGKTSVFEDMAAGANNLITKFGALTASFATVGFAVKPVVDAFISLQSTTRILTQITGSSAEAARQIQFLREAANQSGQVFSEVSASYAKFAASALQTGVSAQEAQAAFKAVSLAAGTLGLSSDQAKRALEALSQIASKGTVNMEELRQQLGDALPGVLPLLAKQLGVTSQELNKIVESGRLAAVDAIPALTAAISELAEQDKQVEGLAASWSRFKNVMIETGTTLAEGPLGKTVGVALAALAGVLRDVAFAGLAVAETLRVVGEGIALVAAAATGNIKSLADFKAELAAIGGGADERMAKLQKNFYGVGDSAGSAAAAATAAAAGIGQAGAAAATAGAAADASAGQHRGLATAATSAGTAAVAAGAQHQAAAGALASAGAATDNFAGKLHRLGLDYGAVVEATKSLVNVADKAIESRKAEGKAIETIAGLVGTETARRAAAALAAEVLAKAEREHADARQRVVDVLQAERDNTEALIVASGKMDSARKTQLAALDENIKKQAALAEQANATARATEDQATAQRVALETIRDNSDRLDELAESYARATANVQSLRAAQVAGRATQEQASAATRDAAVAQRLYADSVEDYLSRLKRKGALQKADLTLEAENIKLLGEASKSRQVAAQVSGELAAKRRDETEALSQESKVLAEQIVQKGLEKQATELQAQAIEAEASKRLGAVEVQRAHLRAINEFTPARRDELILEEKAAQALLIGAAARRAAIVAIEAQTRALKDQAYQALLTRLASSGPGANGGIANLGGAPKPTAPTGPSLSGRTAGSDFSIGQKSGTIGGTYTPPPDGSGDWEWVTNDPARPGGYWKISAAGSTRRNAESQAKNQEAAAAYARAGIPIPKAGIPLLGLPAAVQEQMRFPSAVAPPPPPPPPPATPVASSAPQQHVIDLRVNGVSQGNLSVASATDVDTLKRLIESLTQDKARSS